MRDKCHSNNLIIMKLKNINLGLGLMALLALSSCADDKFSEYRTDMTKNLKEYQYLNNYEPLKKYVEDMKAAGKCNPDFKLGIALEAAEFNKQGLVYCLAGSNFNEMTAGNAMKMASCVKDDGTFDFNTVKDFVTNAQDAGLTIYGHTLAWHSQQNKKYLSKLIADKEIQVDPSQKVEKEDAYTDFSTMNSFPFYVMGYTPEIKDGILISKYPGDWYQYFVVDNYPVDVDAKREYKVTAMIKASEDGQIDVQSGNWGATTSQKMSVSTQWKEQSVTFSGLTTEKAFVVFQPGNFAGDISCKWVKVTHSEAPVMEIETEVHKKTYTDGDFPFHPMGCTPPVINGAIHFVPTGEWSQFFVMTGDDNELDEGDYVVYLDLTSDKDASGVDLTMQNGWGGTAQAISAKVPVAAGRHSVKVEMPKVEGGKYDIILKPQTADATLDVHSVRVCKVTKSNSIPLTPEEKKSLLTDAMGKWIDGMMEATDGYVTSWDVVNEALWGSDNDGDGKFDLQHAATASADDKKNCFYWQDYLGDIDYVRTAVAAARKSFEAHNGDPKKLKLFINDYNLESYWDNNDKLRSLIQWIKDWEADGVTKIDGIASQMHISCYADPVKQENAKNHIVKMLELMKESGKLCKISELDMGYVDAAGKDVTYDQMTEEQHKEMRDLYTFVLKKYFEIIPIDKQYGITQWCATDSPKDSGWRPGLPVGLWDLNYLRKHTYAGFAVGLGAPEYWNNAK